MQVTFDNNDPYPLPEGFYLLGGDLVVDTDDSTYRASYSDCYILKAPKGPITIQFYYDGIADYYEGLIPFYSEPMKFIVDLDISYVDIKSVNAIDYYSTEETILIDTYYYFNVTLILFDQWWYPLPNI
jgi:hypothetical protein